jgi:hypothetical protein
VANERMVVRYDQVPLVLATSYRTLRAGVGDEPWVRRATVVIGASQIHLERLRLTMHNTCLKDPTGAWIGQPTPMTVGVYADVRDVEETDPHTGDTIPSTVPVLVAYCDRPASQLEVELAITAQSHNDEEPF